jgi:hypothetical protein
MKPNDRRGKHGQQRRRNERYNARAGRTDGEIDTISELFSETGGRPDIRNIPDINRRIFDKGTIWARTELQQGVTFDKKPRSPSGSPNGRTTSPCYNGCGTSSQYGSTGNVGRFTEKDRTISNDHKNNKGHDFRSYNPGETTHTSRIGTNRSFPTTASGHQRVHEISEIPSRTFWNNKFVRKSNALERDSRGTGHRTSDGNLQKFEGSKFNNRGNEIHARNTHGGFDTGTCADHRQNVDKLLASVSEFRTGVVTQPNNGTCTKSQREKIARSRSTSSAHSKTETSKKQRTSTQAFGEGTLAGFEQTTSRLESYDGSTSTTPRPTTTRDTGLGTRPDIEFPCTHRAGVEQYTNNTRNDAGLINRFAGNNLPAGYADTVTNDESGSILLDFDDTPQSVYNVNKIDKFIGSLVSDVNTLTSTLLPTRNEIFDDSASGVKSLESNNPSTVIIDIPAPAPYIHRNPSWYKRLFCRSSRFEFGKKNNHNIGDIVTNKTNVDRTTIPDHFIHDQLYNYLVIHKFANYKTRDEKVDHMRKLATKWLYEMEIKYDKFTALELHKHLLTIQKASDEVDTKFLYEFEDPNFSRCCLSRIRCSPRNTLNEY